MIAGVALGILFWAIIVAVAWWIAYGFFPWAAFLVAVVFGLVLALTALL